MQISWPVASYFDGGTPEARDRLADLEFVERANWYELHRRKSDGSYWRLDADDKYRQRFLIRIDAVEDGSTHDSSALEKALLLDRRGGVSDDRCIRQGCREQAVRGLAFCIDHAFEQGVRK